MITGVRAENLHLFWEVVEPWLERACAYSVDGTTVQDLKLWIENQEAQLWIAVDGKIDAAIVTRIVVYPRYKALCVVSAGGANVKHWIAEAESLFTAFGKSCNCDRIELHGRRGWARILKNARIAAITITKDLR